MQKTQRQNAILKLIFSRQIGSQIELANMLRSRNFPVTQASVSRDLERLGVVKANGRYVLQITNGRAGAFGQITFSEAGDNLIVVKCASGLASAAAVRIDAGGVPEIIGTIAGDDTIFIAVKGPAEKSRALKALGRILQSEGQE